MCSVYVRQRMAVSSLPRQSARNTVVTIVTQFTNLPAVDVPVPIGGNLVPRGGRGPPGGGGSVPIGSGGDCDA